MLSGLTTQRIDVTLMEELHMNFWRTAKKFSPALCRLLARTRTKRPALYSLQDIAGRSGLDLFVVSSLAIKTEWDGVPVDVMNKFLKGCDVDFCDSLRMKQHRRLLISKRKDKWRYLRESKEWDQMRVTLEHLHRTTAHCQHG